MIIYNRVETMILVYSKGREPLIYNELNHDINSNEGGGIPGGVVS